MKDNYYFDNAATTFPKPEAVYQFMDEFSRSAAVNPGRASHALAVEAQLMVQQTRQMLASFFGFAGPSERVVFTQNVTDSLNQALYGLLRSGDHVIGSIVEHNSVLRPLNHLERDSNVTVSHLEVDDHGFIDPEQVQHLIREDTKVVVINHGSNVMGAVQDIRRIGEIAHAAGVLLLVDTAQTAGVLDINMSRDNIDLLAFTGHKGLFGPMGTGGLIVGEGVELTPMRVGGTGVDSIDPFQPEDYPHHLEAGTIAVQGISGLHAAQKWFAQLGIEYLDGESFDSEGFDSESLGGENFNREKLASSLTENAPITHRVATNAAVQAIATKELAHTQYIIDAISSHQNITLLGPQLANEKRVATLSFVIKGLPSSMVGDILDADYHICVRTGLHCAPLIHQKFDTLASDGAVRLSPGYFTEDEDIEHLIKAVLEIAS